MSTLFDYIPRGLTGIYKITNSLNNKIYIGQSVDIRRRWTAHINILNDTNKNDIEKRYSIHKALAKYGIENFRFEIVELCDEKDLDDREIYWIDYYNSYLQGYNETLGGNAVRIKPEYVDIIIDLLLNTNKTYEEICALTNVSKTTVGRINMGDNYFSPNLDYPLRKTERPVLQYDMCGTLLHEYASATEASVKTGISRRDICDVCLNFRSNRISSGGYQWRFKEDANVMINRLPKNKKRVGKYDKNGDLLKIFNSAAEAANEESVHRDHISRVCRGERKSLHGYVWKYIDEDM